MITISEITKKETNDVSRIETILYIEEKNSIVKFHLYIETQKRWGKYLVTDRSDAFVVGILIYAMGKKHDIKCILPISAELKFMLETDLIFTLCKNDERFYRTRIIADTTNEPLQNEGAVGTGLSLGLDSFCTIADHYDCEARTLKLTHLLTLQDGAVGGFYQKNNWNYCARKLYEREKKVSEELGLPLIIANTNLTKLMARRVDWYVTYWLVMIVMSFGHLFKTYFVSSVGVGYANFNVDKMYNRDCESYDLLSLSAFSTQGGVRFISGGGSYDRMDKMRKISSFPIAQNNLQSCLTQHFNCMHCMKCKRNLITMDALGVLDKFSKVYDISYYRKNRDEYIDWMCRQVNNNGHDANYIRSSYEMIKKREPEYIRKFELSQQQFVSNYVEIRRQRNVYRRYAKIFRQFISRENSIYQLKQWFENNNIKHVVLYGASASDGVQILLELRHYLNINIDYIVETVQSEQSFPIPRISEDTIEYPECDAVIICNVDKPELIRRKLSGFLTVPVFEISEILNV